MSNSEQLFWEEFSRAYVFVTGDLFSGDRSLGMRLRDVKLDSLDKLEIVELVAQSFSVEISDEQFAEIDTAADLFGFVTRGAEMG